MILTLLAILALLTFVFIIFFIVKRFKGSFMLTADGSAMLTTYRVHIWSPIYRHPIPITIKVGVILAKAVRRFES